MKSKKRLQQKWAMAKIKGVDMLIMVSVEAYNRKDALKRLDEKMKARIEELNKE